MRKSYFPRIGDAELVLGALIGDLEAFDELVRRFWNAVVVVARQELRTREAAEDVAQDTFLIAFKALPQLDDPEKFAGWLCAIARHRARRVGLRDSRTTPTERTALDCLVLDY